MNQKGPAQPLWHEMPALVPGGPYSKLVHNMITVIDELFENGSSKHNTHIHVAFIVKRGKILSVGTNAVGSRTRGCGYNHLTIHAEIAALKKLDWRLLSGADMYIFRWRPAHREIAYSYPCHGCMTVLNKCIRVWGLNKIYYSTDWNPPTNYQTNLKVCHCATCSHPKIIHHGSQYHNHYQ